MARDPKMTHGRKSTRGRPARGTLVGSARMSMNAEAEASEGLDSSSHLADASSAEGTVSTSHAEAQTGSAEGMDSSSHAAVRRHNLLRHLAELRK